jgi:hypothetical protein
VILAWPFWRIVADVRDVRAPMALKAEKSFMVTVLLQGKKVGTLEFLDTHHAYLYNPPKIVEICVDDSNARHGPVTIENTDLHLRGINYPACMKPVR